MYAGRGLPGGTTLLRLLGERRGDSKTYRPWPETLRRRELAAKLRARVQTMPQIAAEMGVSKQAVCVMLRARNRGQGFCASSPDAA